ncbi:MAG: hypothetical protein L6Q78_12375 [Bacteroidia bacterium]|nr:hypothetical protein [Bacteroidia bacterium]
MILIITHKTDFTADFVINKLNQRGIAYKRLNCEDIFKDEYKIKLNSNFTYSILGEEKYKSVWFRRTKLPEIKGLKREEKLYILYETESLFENIFSTLTANWLSSPSAVYEAENKLLQLKTAIKIGFNIPQTLITNSKQELKQFYSDCNHDIILKPISQTRIQYNEGSAFIFTNPIPEDYITNIESYDLTPCIYQKNIPKEYELRVTVVGDLVFSAAVYSQADEETKNDWRKKKLKFEPVEIPNEIQQKCITLLKELDLKFGAIDLIKTPNEEYVFLEINPNGQWAWIETQTGQKISDAIINQLIK